MKNPKVIAFLNALGAAAYVALVASVMQSGEKIFGTVNNMLGPIAFILLFVLSATVVGGLILAKPVMMYIDGQKKEAVAMFFRTVSWLVVFTLTAFLTLIII